MDVFFTVAFVGVVVWLLMRFLASPRPTPPGPTSWSSPAGWTPPSGAPAAPSSAPLVPASPDPVLLARLATLEREVAELRARLDVAARPPDRVQAPATGPADGGPLVAEVRALLAAGRKIEAIKRYREATGVGLAEAKDVVDAFEHGIEG